METYGLILEQESLKFLYDPTGASYKTPIACINEPVNYGEDIEVERLKKASEPEECVTLNLKIRNSATFEDKTLEIDSSETVLELKNRYVQLMDKDENTKVRLLSSGRELKDEAKLYQYSINDELLLIAILK